MGVGDAVFDAMDELDSDDVRLTVKGRYAERDIVQFVPLNKFLAKNGESIKSQADLAKEVSVMNQDIFSITNFEKTTVKDTLQLNNAPYNQN